ncbi:respiratory nitrate reductase subunit gamma, partial [bacterium]
MQAALAYLDQIFFGVLPYLAIMLFLLVSIQRYRDQKFTYSSLSSQFLENEQHFWALVPFHYGILIVLTGHVVAFLIPRQILAFNGAPLRLYILEVSALIFGLMTLIGLDVILVRRWVFVKARTVTTPSDWVLYLLLLLQAFTGVYSAVVHPWGSSWFAAAATPYLWSVLKLNPEISYVVAMPWMVKLHIVNAWLVIGFFPFTRLVHILVVPNHYLWRRTQVVRWN